MNNNDRRIALTDGQRAKAVTAMFELGLSATKIAKTMQYDNRDTAKAAGTAGRSQTAIDALDAGQLDFEQAAVVAVCPRRHMTMPLPRSRILGCERILGPHHRGKS